ncbi:single-stranded DNA-binding protein [Anaerophilus nitritogenes]|uniref:single-stranded DNA-binding protein n=1 Tax=Anaerophilus nitritogenes TaxID=2498136 RepID=UPI00101D9BF4|nr:single-stranded DNA-binding protein [Anaerophilus nitritogenes]
MNQVILIGRLTKDPELRFTAGSGKAVCTFNLAVNRLFAKDNEADFFRIVSWGKTGENAANYLYKGSQVAVQGRLQNNNYEKDGVKHYSIEVVAERVKFLDSKPKQENPEDGFQEIDDDDIPF